MTSVGATNDPAKDGKGGEPKRDISTENGENAKQDAKCFVHKTNPPVGIV